MVAKMSGIQRLADSNENRIRGRFSSTFMRCLLAVVLVLLAACALQKPQQAHAETTGYAIFDGNTHGSWFYADEYFTSEITVENLIPEDQRDQIVHAKKDLLALVTADTFKGCTNLKDIWFHNSSSEPCTLKDNFFVDSPNLEELTLSGRRINVAPNTFRNTDGSVANPNLSRVILPYYYYDTKAEQVAEDPSPDPEEMIGNVEDTKAALIAAGAPSTIEVVKAPLPPGCRTLEELTPELQRAADAFESLPTSGPDLEYWARTDLTDGSYAEGPLVAKAVEDANLNDSMTADEVLEALSRSMLDKLHYKGGDDIASAERTLEKGQGTCVTYARVLTAMCRKAGYPAFSSTADVFHKGLRNYYIGSVLDVQAGYELIEGHAWTTVFIGGKWRQIDSLSSDPSDEGYRTLVMPGDALVEENGSAYIYGEFGTYGVNIRPTSKLDCTFDEGVTGADGTITYTVHFATDPKLNKQYGVLRLTPTSTEENPGGANQFFKDNKQGRAWQSDGTLTMLIQDGATITVPAHTAVAVNAAACGLYDGNYDKSDFDDVFRLEGPAQDYPALQGGESLRMENLTASLVDGHVQLDWDLAGGLGDETKITSTVSYAKKADVDAGATNAWKTVALNTGLASRTTTQAVFAPNMLPAGDYYYKVAICDGSMAQVKDEAQTTLTLPAPAPCVPVGVTVKDDAPDNQVILANDSVPGNNAMRLYEVNEDGNIVAEPVWEQSMVVGRSNITLTDVPAGTHSYVLVAYPYKSSTDTMPQNFSPFIATVTVTGLTPPTPTVWTRLAGAEAIDTMAAITAEGFADGSCSTVVVATLAGYQDALTATGLAGLFNCPVLLTEKDSLSSVTSTEINRLAAAEGIKVYIVGGTAVVSDNTKNEIEELSLVSDVERLSGTTATDTALAVYKEGIGSWSETAIIATSITFQDALSVSPYAYAKHAPIFLAEADTKLLKNEVAQAINNDGFKNVTVVGGSAVIGEGVSGQLNQVPKRLAGETAYDTSIEIAKWCLDNGMVVDNMSVATGQGYYDALSGASLCGINNAILVLMNESNRGAIDAVITPNKTSITQGYVFGGTAVITNDVFADLERATAL